MPAPRHLWLIPFVGAMYVAVHSAFEIASGALPYNYRYPLEAVAFVAPFLIVVTQEGESSRLGRGLIFVGAAVAVTLQATYSLVSRCGFFPSDPTERICFLFG